ncbi:MAG: TolC family protein [Gemmatimonadota bacterium]|nr:MAG: TolC family protein [Gemmatimonadota bacterium]
MKSFALILLVSVALGAPRALRCQEPLPSVPQSLSLRDAVDLAMQYNPAYRQTANDHAPAAWGVRNAYAAFLPTFGITGGMSYAGAGTQNFFGTTSFEQVSSTVGSNYSMGFNLSISGRTFTQPALARAQLKAANADIDGAEINLESAVREQYLAVLQAEAQVELAELQVTRNQEFLRLAQARFDVGQNTILDVRQAEVALGRAEIERLQFGQAVIVEKLRLFQQMGVPAPDDPTVVVLSDTFPIMDPVWELGDLMDDANARNPDLLSLRARQSAAVANETAVKTDWLPSLSFAAGWSGFTNQFTNPDPLINNSVLSAQASAAGNMEFCEDWNDIVAGLATPTADPRDCSVYEFTADDEAELRQTLRDQNSVFPFNFTSQPFAARMTVSWPIFTQFSRPLRNSQASAQADDAKEAVRAWELQVRTAVSQAYYGMLAAHEGIGIQEQSRIAAQEGLDLARERYRVGSGTFFELLDAQLAAQTAERDYINAVYAYHRSIATLEAAVGRPLR